MCVSSSLSYLVNTYTSKENYISLNFNINYITIMNSVTFWTFGKRDTLFFGQSPVCFALKSNTLDILAHRTPNPPHVPIFIRYFSYCLSKSVQSSKRVIRISCSQWYYVSSEPRVYKSCINIWLKLLPTQNFFYHNIIMSVFFRWSVNFQLWWHIGTGLRNEWSIRKYYDLPHLYNLYEKN